MAKSSRRDVIVIGAGGTGTDVAAWMAETEPAEAGYRVIGFLDDAPEKQGTLVSGLPVLGPLRAAPAWPNARFVNTIGSPTRFWRRGDVVASCNIGLDQLETIIHPRAVVHRGAEVGPGSVLYPQAVVSASARLGSQVVLLANAVVNHDVVVGDCTIVASGATLGGRVCVGRGCYIGAGAHVIQDASVGDGALVGMGSVVLKNVPSDSVVAGNPARVLRPVQRL